MQEIQLSNGGVAIIDDVDIDKVTGHTWRRDKEGYATTMITLQKGKHRPQRLHRVIMECVPGDGKIVDHCNFDRLDCRKENLRMATKRQNQQHQRGNAGSVSCYKGVSKCTTSGRWRARIGSRHIGSYRSEIDAAHAYDQQAILEHGEFAYLNFPQKEV